MKPVVCVTLALLVLVGSSLAGQDSTKAKYDNSTVYLEKVTAKPGEHFAVKVYLFNTDTLAGLQVPIFYRAENINLYCDSLSLLGSRCEYMMFNDVKIPEGDKIVYFSFINTIDPKQFIDPLPPGDGLLATIYFTAPKDSKEGEVKLARGMIEHPHISYTFALWDKIGGEVNSTFEDGIITIKK